MPFDANGTHSRVDTGSTTWRDDAAAGIKIRSDLHDNHDNDISQSLSECITKTGKTQPLANIPFNQKRIINLGEPQEPNDAATKNYVDNFKTFGTGMTVTGANFPNGMINFAATTGTTGLSFTNADMCWAGKPFEAGKWRGRIAAIQGAAGTGAEMVTIDSAGVIGNNNGQYTHNLSFDGTNWRTNAPGTGTIMSLVNGVLALSSNDTVTDEANEIATMDQFFQVDQGGISHRNTHATLGGSSSLSLSKKEAGSNGNYIWGYAGTEARWRIDLGNATAESGTWTGTDYYTYSWDNTGANAKAMFALHRNDNHGQFWGDVYTTTGAFRGNGAVAILSAQGGPAILRPYGAENGTYQAYAHTDGYFHLNSHFTIDAHTTYGVLAGIGVRSKNGMYGGFGGNWHNWLWASGYVYALVDNSNVGAIQMVCDYRTKRDVRELPSMWDRVKTLHPIKYKYRGVPDMITGDEDDDEERWGFVAHELQTQLTHSAASFDKDVHNALQAPNLMVIVAALTKALQEAQARIEALEAKLA